MFSLQRFLSKSDKFFDLLEASAEEAQNSVTALVELMKAPNEGRKLDECILSRRHEKRLNEEITTLLCSTFVTPLEREDIEELSRSLYRIPKTIEKFGERLLLSQASVRFELFDRQMALVQRATETLRQMVRQLRGTVSLDKIKADNDRLHHYEGEADKLMIDLLREIYSGKYEPLAMIVMRDLFELLEKAIDRCRDAGNVVFQIVLKNS
jgi:uncharacterized protein Yka (UPF0111/DUF47 family)